MYKVEVRAMPKKEILDPQGAAVKNSLHKMGYSEVMDVRIGKSIELFFEREEYFDQERVLEMCDKLLVNDVIEDCEILICLDEE